jgi:hypothetical protein
MMTVPELAPGGPMASYQRKLTSEISSSIPAAADEIHTLHSIAVLFRASLEFRVSSTHP